MQAGDGLRTDELWMKEALRLSGRGRGRTSPNPMVGAVAVNQGRLAGSGWHRRAGEPHAEVLALRGAGPAARGATVFVSLEPCAHHGRTPPCAQALIEAGVARVVIAVRDPDPGTSGKGIKALQEAGIEVEVGVLEGPARLLNEAYLLHRTQRRPFVTLKAAASLDGRTSAQDGTSRWITGEPARLDGHRLRAHSDAVCAGIGTILTDDSLLTVRGLTSGRQPLRVVVDSKARTPLGARVLSTDVPTVIFTAQEDAAQKVAILRRAGATVISVPGPDGRVCLAGMLLRLGEMGVVSLLVEGGARLAGALGAEGLIDKFVFYFAPKLAGGGHAKGIIDGWEAGSIDRAMDLDIAGVKRIGRDLRVTAYPARKTQEGV